jgi:hypothetical protein
MPSSLALVVLLGAAGAWSLSLFFPGWTGAVRESAGRYRWRWAAVLGGVLAVALADPVLPLVPGRALAEAGASLLQPALGARVTPLLLGAVALAIPVLADARLAPAGLPSFAPAARRWLLAAGEVAGIALAPLLIARWVTVDWSVPDPRLPNLLWLIAAGAVLALAGVRATAGRRPRGPGRLLSAWGWGIAVGLAGMFALGAAPEIALTLAIPAFWLASAALWAVSRRGGGRTEGDLWWRLALAGTLLLAFHLRWRFLVDTPGWAIPLSSDAQSYFDEALYLDRLLVDRHTNLLALFFEGSTAFREPLFIYLLHGWLHLVGPRDLHSVYLTILAGVAWVGVSAVAVRLLLGPGAGLLTALLLAVDAIWIRNAAVGLREEVTGVLLGLLVVVLWTARAGRPWLLWLAPFLAGAAAVTRLDALPFALFVLGWAAVAQRWSLVRSALMLALVAAVLLPTFAGYARSRGEAAPASTEIATNNWKEVFKDRLGEPGFEPDRRVTATDFLFRYFTPAQLVVYTVRGYARIYGQEVFESHYYLLANAADGWGRYLGLGAPGLVPLIYLAGTAGLLLTQRLRWRRTWLVPALCVAGAIPPIGFVAGVPGHPALYQARYAYMVAPYAAATVAWALVAGGSWLAGRALSQAALPRVTPAREGDGGRRRPDDAVAVANRKWI